MSYVRSRSLGSVASTAWDALKSPFESVAEEQEPELVGIDQSEYPRQERDPGSTTSPHLLPPETGTVQQAGGTGILLIGAGVFLLMVLTDRKR